MVVRATCKIRVTLKKNDSKHVLASLLDNVCGGCFLVTIPIKQRVRVRLTKLGYNIRRCQRAKKKCVPEHGYGSHKVSWDAKYN